MNKTATPQKRLNKAFIVFILFLLLPLGAIAISNLEYQNVPFPNIFLNSKSYSRISRDVAESMLTQDIQEKYKEGLKLKYKDQEFTVTLSELGMQIDQTKTLDQIFSYGKKKDLILSAQEQWQIIFGKSEMKNELSDSGFLIEENKWKEISAIETPTANFSYKYQDGQFVPQKTHDGIIINQEKLKKDIKNNLINLENEPITLQLVDEKVVIEKDQDKTALDNAKKLLNKKIFLEYDSSSWEVSREDLGTWIGFEPELDGRSYKLRLSPAKSVMEEYLVALVPQINQEPVNAQLEFKDGKISMFSLSRVGIKVNIEQSIQEIGKQLFQDRYYSDDREEIRIKLITENIEPQITTESIDNMGITSLLATGESNFHGSTKSRIHNVTVGAGKFNGVLIGPGDKFSFVSILGEVGPKEGYLPELVIKQGKTTPEYGGGLCQVSTTAFRAAVKAGLEITERKNHAYAVKYYSPQGTDATIYPPHPDLAFVNNTPGYILIQTRISGNNLYFDFYGSNDNRKVELEGPVVYERGTGGAMKTWWKQKVYKEDGSLMHENTFYSNYKSPDLYPRTNPLE
jgi:vancomycin resistance protein YoaR